jgi:feruloyl-CoA synthase
LRGPNITPGYWRDDEQTRAAFDEEGFYRMGDAIAPADPDDPQIRRGFMFHGRINEDFKLSTGTWVRVGSVRARLLAAFGDLAQDVVITGHGRDLVGALVFPHAAACRRLAGAAPDVPIATVVATPAVRDAFAERLEHYNAANPGSSTAIHRMVLLETPPSLEAMEITDKGSINQRAVLAHRADQVHRLYAATGDSLLA